MMAIGCVVVMRSGISTRATGAPAAANYLPLGVVSGQIIMQFDKDAPKRRICRAGHEPGTGQLKDADSRGRPANRGTSLVAGKIGILSLQDVASVVRLYAGAAGYERVTSLCAGQV